MIPSGGKRRSHWADFAVSPGEMFSGSLAIAGGNEWHPAVSTSGPFFIRRIDNSRGAGTTSISISGKRRLAACGWTSTKDRSRFRPACSGAGSALYNWAVVADYFFDDVVVTRSIDGERHPTGHINPPVKSPVLPGRSSSRRSTMPLEYRHGTRRRGC